MQFLFTKIQKNCKNATRFFLKWTMAKLETHAKITVFKQAKHLPVELKGDGRDSK